MARVGEQQNKDANAQMAAIQQQQNARLMGYQDKFAADQSKLNAGQDIGANPYRSADYLRNRNLVSATTADAVNSAEQNQLESTTRRTGLNSSSLGYTKADMGRNKVRALVDYNAGQNTQDYQNNIDYQRWLLGNDMAPAGVANTMFGNATGGRSGALKNLTDIGMASYGPWSSLISAAGTAGGGFLQSMNNQPPASGGGNWWTASIPHR